jgi:hypothetical protein
MGLAAQRRGRLRLSIGLFSSFYLAFGRFTAALQMDPPDLLHCALD